MSNWYYTVQSEKEWIRTHLMLVEKTLRSRSITHLTQSQQANRAKDLDNLHKYWKAGNFPVNDRYSYRTPIFIDPYDNFCAVGFLVKASGNESVSRMIAANSNLAYVRNMNYPELFTWADDHGFTEDELAWIQPAYPPARHAAGIGKGTNGEIFELFADNHNGKLYVGGRFDKVDSTITANNIAYITEAGGNYTWHNMGSGINGTVHAITTFGNKIFVAGTFTEAGGNSVDNVAYWDGSGWNAAGCLYGIVKDLTVYKNQLYAAGHFDVCGGLAEVNFARWNGTHWMPLPGLTGTANTLEVVGNEIFIGGNFSYGSGGRNIIRWSDINGFQMFDNVLENEVNDIEVFGDTVYAVCSRTSPNDSSLINKLRQNTWEQESPYLTSVWYTASNSVSFKTLCMQADTLMIGGSFHLTPVVGNFSINCYSLLNPGGSSNWFNVDSTINKMVLFKGELIAGGCFRSGSNGSFTWNNNPLNSIARKTYGATTSVPGKDISHEKIVVYPNPYTAGRLTIENNFGADKLTISDISGRPVASFRLKTGKEQILLPGLPGGNYVIELRNKQGTVITQKLIIQ